MEGGVSWNLMLSSDLLISKIPICGGRGFLEFDVEFRFANIQNSHLWRGGRVGGTNFQLLMLSPNLLKKKFFCEHFSKFSGKNVPGNGFRL